MLHSLEAHLYQIDHNLKIEKGEISSQKFRIDEEELNKLQYFKNLEIVYKYQFEYKITFNNKNPQQCINGMCKLR